MKKYKRSHKVYAAWDYGREQEALNRESEQGWQLIHGGCFSAKFEWDDGVVYRYQLDYRPRLENRMRYIEAFREQGWEYINGTFNGWHVFRKRYDPALPASEYEIYTDRPSREEMARRIGRLLGGVGAIVLALALVALVWILRRPEAAMLGILLETSVGAACLLTGARRMRRVGRGEAIGRGVSWGAMVLAVCVGLTWFAAFSHLKVRVNMTWNAEAAGERTSLEMPEVRVPDFYYLTAETSGAASVRILDEDGTPVYEASGDPLALDDVRVPLKRGAYQIEATLSSAPEDQIRLELD